MRQERSQDGVERIRAVRLIVVVVAALILLWPSASACDDGMSDGPWSGWVYPDRSNLLVDEYLGLFPSLDACRARALQRLAALEQQSGRIGDYECGSNCRLSETGSGLNICDQTSR